MKITLKWVKAKRSTLEGEIQTLQRRGTQLQQNVAQLQQKISEALSALLIKQGELSAIEEVTQELLRKKEEVKKP